MKKHPDEPFLVPERCDTVRHEITILLNAGPLSSREISSRAGVSEKEVLEHLSHIRISSGKGFEMTPASCRSCGFTFSKRERLKKPGKCPLCRGEFIEPPLYSIKTR